jgi:hypothetical protein
VYVLLGREGGRKPVRYFIARNCDLPDALEQRGKIDRDRNHHAPTTVAKSSVSIN